MKKALAPLQQVRIQRSMCAAFLLIWWLGILSCESPVAREGVLPTSTMPLSPAHGPEPIDLTTPTVVPIITPTSVPPPAVPPPEVCQNFLLREDTLPDLSLLRWETLLINDHTVRQLTGLRYPPILLGVSPNDRWLVVAFQDRTGHAAVAMIDTQENAHWWLNKDTYYAATPSFNPWLPDGRLLWVDETGSVFLGDGLERQSLASPKPMTYIQVVSNGIAFAYTEDDEVWRVELNSGRWEKVSDEIRGGPLGIAQDGSHAVVFAHDRMWRIPVAMGAAAETIPLQEIDVLGSGAPIPSPTHLAGSPYWLRHLAWHPEKQTRIAGKAVWRLGVVIDERDGRILNLGDFPVPKEYNFDVLYTAPPSGRWLAVSLLALKENPPQVRKRAVYVTPGNNLTAGYLVEGFSVAGWHTDPPAIILRDPDTNILSILQLPITVDSKPMSLNSRGQLLAQVPGAILLRGGVTDRLTVVRLIPASWMQRSAMRTSKSILHGAGELLMDGTGKVARTPSTILTTAADNPARVLQFDLDGNLLGLLDLSARYDAITAGMGMTDRVFLSATDTRRLERPICLYALVEWMVTPS